MENLSFENIVLKKLFKGNGSIGHTEAKKYLRHDHPMLGVDRIIDHNFDDEWIHAVRGISCSHPAFEGHFKEMAVYPGTTLCQDVIQVCILLFIGATGELNTDNNNKEVTVVSSLNVNIGHPIPPGSILDIAVWSAKRKGKRAIEFDFDVKMRDFEFYSKKTKYGITFSSALSGKAEIMRVKQKLYNGIGL